jgi:hypothetical protein
MTKAFGADTATFIGTALVVNYRSYSTFLEVVVLSDTGGATV